MYKVSVIVPVYNVEIYLERCINSIINQTLRDIEIICINDGSTDNSLEILEEYAKKDSRIKIINKENSGVSDARNEGLENATGEYIGFVDPDDWIDLDFFEKLYNNAKQNNCDIAVADIVRVKKDKEKIIYTSKYRQFSNNFYEKLLICNAPDISYIWNKIYRASKLKKHNLKFKSSMCFEDIIFTPQILLKLDNLITVPNTYYYYFKRKNSIIHDKTKQKDYYAANDICDKLLNEQNIPIEKIRTITKKYKFLGFTILKTQKKNSIVKIQLFKIIKWAYVIK
ncbi:glycosyltransferase [bacterium]|nr:glycosyltransferase [bacterium]